MARSLAAGRRVKLAARRPVRRRGRGEAGRQGDVPPRAAVRRRDRARRHRRHLRGVEGRVRGHPLHPRARRRARDRRREGVGRAAPDEGPHVRRDRLRRQHELRPAALRRRARRAGRAARGDPRGDHSGAAGQLSRVLPAPRQALGHRIQLPLCRCAHRAPLRRDRGREPPRDRAPARASSSSAGSRPTTCPTTRWPSCTSGTWSAGTRRRRRTKSSTASSFRSGRAR